ATVAAGDDALWRGAALHLTWRGTRPAVRAIAFDAKQQPSESRAAVSRNNANALDMRFVGGALEIDGLEDFDTWAARYRLGASTSRVRRDAAPSLGGTDSTTARTLLLADGSAGRTEIGRAS